MRNKDTVQVAKIRVNADRSIEIVESLPTSVAVRTEWSLPTQGFHKVSVIMNSPNHWNDVATGNKHTFFMLEGCKSDLTPRGFYNEFLLESLDAHRKVLEVVGAKMKIDDSDSQLSGLGFSSTQRNTLLCRVKGSFTRTLNINF